MKRTLLILLALVWATAAAGQSLVVSLPFETRFDNREYSACHDKQESFTLFGVKFQPEVGVEWAGMNRLMAGATLLHEFGDERALSEAGLLLYYQFQSPTVRVNAGIFPRSKLIGHYSEALFDEKVSFYHPTLQGLLFNWQSPRNRSYTELWIDWEGLRTATQREKFRITLDGRWDNGRFYAGGSAMMLHYAKSYSPDAGTTEGVVDNLLLNPHLGLRVGSEWRFEARLGYLQAMQRDRRLNNGWRAPLGGELWLSLDWRGFRLDNKLYVGENLQPLYATYGANLFEASTFYGVESGLYNCTSLSYDRRFFDDTLEVGASLRFHCDLEGVGLQQILRLGVNLEKIFSKGSRTASREK